MTGSTDSEFTITDDDLKDIVADAMVESDPEAMTVSEILFDEFPEFGDLDWDAQDDLVQRGCDLWASARVEISWDDE